jgi:hypothetical protein
MLEEQPTCRSLMLRSAGVHTHDMRLGSEVKSRCPYASKRAPNLKLGERGAVN